MSMSFARHQFPPAIIRHAVWLYVRFTLSYRDRTAAMSTWREAVAAA
jgi:transposase-like protein